jgi:hypothetical protein
MVFSNGETAGVLLIRAQCLPHSIFVYAWARWARAFLVYKEGAEAVLSDGDEDIGELLVQKLLFLLVAGSNNNDKKNACGVDEEQEQEGEDTLHYVAYVMANLTQVSVLILATHVRSSDAPSQRSRALG